MAESLIYQRRGNQLVKLDTSTMTHANIGDVLDALQSAAASLNAVMSFLTSYYEIPASSGTSDTSGSGTS